MTNYNDGNWHLWNGGECPVHPKALVAAIWRGISMNEDDYISGAVRKAEDFQEECWDHNLCADDESDIIAFRVIKEYKKPAEMMIGKGDDGSLVAFVVGEWSDLSAYKAKGFTHVREVQQ